MSQTIDEDAPILQTVSEPLQQLLIQRIEERKQAVDHPKQQDVVRFRPTHRPPMAFVTALDDGSDSDGELLRIRTTRFEFGRSTGDFTVPFDPDMSAVHASLECKHVKGNYQWFLVDEESKNGTFLRAFKARPRPGAELVIGSRRYEFLPGTPVTNPVKANPEATITYVRPDADEISSGVPRLVEITGTEEGGTLLSLSSDNVTVGSSNDCSLQIDDDPLVSPVHAKFFRDQQNRWVIEDLKSVNGVWIRIKRIALAHQAEFQLGQQRFLFETR